MNEYIERIKQTTYPLRKQIINHKVYSVINDIDELKIFMQYHVFAAWGFMSLLKALQNNHISVPPFSGASSDTKHLIHEIVVGGESYLDSFGNRKNHFELCLAAMHQCGADTSQIEKFIDELKSNGDFNLAYASSQTPKPARDFVDFIFKIIGSNKDYLQAAIFTFGREDLIPEMFFSFINELHKKYLDRISIFKHYFEIHRGVDNAYHGHLALQITSNLCGTNKQFWKEVELATMESLQKRIDLWDGVYEHITIRKKAIAKADSKIVYRKR